MRASPPPSLDSPIIVTISWSMALIVLLTFFRTPSRDFRHRDAPCSMAASSDEWHRRPGRPIATDAGQAQSGDASGKRAPQAIVLRISFNLGGRPTERIPDLLAIPEPRPWRPALRLASSSIERRCIAARRICVTDSRIGAHHVHEAHPVHRLGETGSPGRKWQPSSTRVRRSRRLRRLGQT